MSEADAAGGPDRAPPGRLKKRSEFLAARDGAKRRGRWFMVEIKARGDEAPARVGFTITRKCGTATERNRIRRRLRDAVRRDAARDMQPGTDYVIVGRREALDAPFAELAAELRRRIRNRN
ncbi:MAG: ribonuclease P protein component [Phyllobacteriaceae bacterium]|nr:ribonuclease P protein component [Phyllobacteriaceae bacterium]